MENWVSIDISKVQADYSAPGWEHLPSQCQKSDGQKLLSVFNSTAKALIIFSRAI